MMGSRMRSVVGVGVVQLVDSLLTAANVWRGMGHDSVSIVNDL